MSKELLKAIINEDKTDRAGVELMASKIDTRLADVRKEVAQRMFN